MTYASREDVAGKIENEGGIWDFLEYGLRPDDMPDEELKGWARALVDEWECVRHTASKFLDLLPDPDDL